MRDIDFQISKLRQTRKDFEVRYRFFSTAEGGRETRPAQFYRCDWLYDEDRVEDGIFMIWPIFLAANGEIMEPDIEVPAEGVAQMFIVNDEFRKDIHAPRLKPGVRGYFMEGPNAVAEAIVTQLLSIAEA